MRWFGVAPFALLIAGAAAHAGEPSSRQIAWRFAEAVKVGGDVTLAGVVPVTESQRTQLARLKGCKFQRMPVSNVKRSIFLWACPQGREGNDYLTDIHFDGLRVIRFDISTAIRSNLRG